MTKNVGRIISDAINAKPIETKITVPICWNGTKEEVVKIQSSSDLNNFVKRVIKMSQDSKLKSDVLTGKHIFRRVNHDQETPIDAHQPISKMPKKGQTIIFEGGMITLRDVESLSKNTKSLTVGKSTHCTPLALDEIRRRNIKIEREIKW